MSEWLLLQSAYVVYPALFFLLLMGAVGLPVPEDLPLILAGITSHRGVTDPTWAFIVCYSGVILGDLIIFSLGKRFGPGIFQKKWIKSKISKRRIGKLRIQLERRSLIMIFVARHLFYLRTMTFLTCGAVNMSYRRFIMADMIAAIISIPLMMWIGYIFSEQYETALNYASQIKTWSVVLGVVVLLLLLVLYLIRKQNKPPAAPKTSQTDI